MVLWKSDRVDMGSPAYSKAKAQAEAQAATLGGRVEWQDEYNDYSARGVFVVRRGR